MMTLKGKRKHLKIERAHTWHDPIKRLSFEYKNISIDLLFNKGDFFLMNTQVLEIKCHPKLHS